MKARLSLPEFVENKKVIIVGPGSTVKDDCKDLNVDGFDLICRLNKHWRLQKGDHAVLGHRTDILYHCMNQNQYCRKDVQFWKANDYRVVSRVDIDKLKSHAKSRHFRQLNVGINLPLDLVPNTFFNKCKADLGCNPSTGILTILHLLSMPVESVTVVGFDFYQSLYLYRTDEKWREVIHRMDHDPKKQAITFKKVIAENPTMSERFIPVGALKTVMDGIDLTQED